MNKPSNRDGSWLQREARLAERGKTRGVVTQIYDGGQLVGSVDRIGLRFESFARSGRYIGRFYNLDQAIEAVKSAHQSARIVSGFFG